MNDCLTLQKILGNSIRTTSKKRKLILPLSDNSKHANKNNNPNITIRAQYNNFIEEIHSIITGFSIRINWKSNYSLPEIHSIYDILDHIDSSDQYLELIGNIGYYGNDIILTAYIPLENNPRALLVLFDIHVRSPSNLHNSLQYLMKKPNRIPSYEPPDQLTINANIARFCDPVCNFVQLETSNKCIHDAFWYCFETISGQPLWYSVYFAQFSNKEPSSLRGGWFITKKHEHACKDFIQLITQNVYKSSSSSTLNSNTSSPSYSSQIECSFIDSFSLDSDSGLSLSQECSTLQNSKDFSANETTIVIHNSKQLPIWKRYLDKYSIVYEEINDSNIFYDKIKFCQVLLVPSTIFKNTQYDLLKKQLQSKYWYRVIVVDTSIVPTIINSNPSRSLVNNNNKTSNQFLNSIYLWIHSTIDVTVQTITDQSILFHFPPSIPQTVSKKLMDRFTIYHYDSIESPAYLSKQIH
jgi:hypothetical protein